MTISERVQYANQLDADAFVSIHLNASETVAPSGFMTFILSPEGLDESETRLIHFETLEPGVLATRSNQKFRSTDTEDILLDMTVNHAQLVSASLAQEIQLALKTVSAFPDLGVRQAPFHVLMGGTMPAVVCELGFLNHPKEGAYVMSIRGQNELAQGLGKGILTFLNRSEFNLKNVKKR